MIGAILSTPQRRVSAIFHALSGKRTSSALTLLDEYMLFATIDFVDQPRLGVLLLFHPSMKGPI